MTIVMASLLLSRRRTSKLSLLGAIRNFEVASPFTAAGGIVRDPSKVIPIWPTNCAHQQLSRRGVTCNERDTTTTTTKTAATDAECMMMR